MRRNTSQVETLQSPTTASETSKGGGRDHGQKSAGGCKSCSSGSGDKVGLGWLWCKFWEMVYNNTKYFFYALVLFLFPSAFYRYFFKYGDYPWNDFFLFIKFSISAFCAVMAYWSHRQACPPADPGYLEWEHFRSERELQDASDRAKWNDPAYKSQKAAQDGADPENVDALSIQCQQCGCMKVEGVHHCSQCNRCVYKMDHHCPWTNNCVGFLTLKPFLLFLFYVVALCFFTVIWMYRIAWSQGMRHITLLQLLAPQSQLRDSMMLYYMPEEERKAYVEQQRIDFERRVQEQKSGQDEVFTIQALKDGWAEFMTPSEFSIMYSWGHFYDTFTILLTLVMGIYCLFLFTTTVLYVRSQSSLVESFKQARLRKKKRADLTPQERAVFRIKKVLTYEQLCQAILGEPKISLMSFIPIYPADRNLAAASKAYFEKDK